MKLFPLLAILVVGLGLGWNIGFHMGNAPWPEIVNRALAASRQWESNYNEMHEAFDLMKQANTKNARNANACLSDLRGLVSVAHASAKQ